MESPIPQSILLAAALSGAALLLLGLLGLEPVRARARRQYRRLVSEQDQPEPPAAQPDGDRHLVGAWGCVAIGLELARGLGLALILTAALLAALN